MEMMHLRAAWFGACLTALPAIGWSQTTPPAAGQTPPATTAVPSAGDPATAAQTAPGVAGKSAPAAAPAAPAAPSTAPATAAPAAPAAPAAAATAAPASADGKTVEDGKYMTADGDPSYNVKPDGTVDWYTYNGFRRYHADCHVCHGPEGLGSSYAPNLVESLKRLSYAQFADVVTNGKMDLSGGQNKVMPAFGTNRSVICYLDDYYAYLKARSDDKLARGRPQKRDEKPEAAISFEKACQEL